MSCATSSDPQQPLDPKICDEMGGHKDPHLLFPSTF